jgi:hypothetical protein
MPLMRTSYGNLASRQLSFLRISTQLLSLLSRARSTSSLQMFVLTTIVERDDKPWTTELAFDP